MTAFQGTPGPWGLIKEAGDYITVTAPNGFGIAEVDSDDTFDMQRDGEAEANAHLIAAAPELLEACQQLIAAIGVGGPWLHDLTIRTQAAIAKALGEVQA